MNLYPQLDVDLIVTPHHGSARTVQPDFLNALKPELLITSCSETARISQEITDFAQSYYTCKDGAITVSVNRTGQIRIKTFK
jgi:beta-lactamase superfamily II metal-dependent hydrolase